MSTALTFCRLAILNSFVFTFSTTFTSTSTTHSGHTKHIERCLIKTWKTLTRSTRKQKRVSVFAKDFVFVTASASNKKDSNMASQQQPRRSQQATQPISRTHGHHSFWDILHMFAMISRLPGLDFFWSGIWQPLIVSDPLHITQKTNTSQLSPHVKISNLSPTTLSLCSHELCNPTHRGLFFSSQFLISCCLVSHHHRRRWTVSL